MTETQVSESQAKSGSKFIKILKGALLLAVAAVLAFVILGMFVLDGTYEVAREITINASPQAVHQQVGDLREWPNWLPFTKHDPSVKTEIERPTGVGAHQHWTSDNGNGELTFTASDEQQGIEYEMLFDKKWPAKGSLTYASAGEGTRVTWRMAGHNTDLMGKWMALLMSDMVGPMFDEGLADLKNQVEAKE